MLAGLCAGNYTNFTGNLSSSVVGKNGFAEVVRSNVHVIIVVFAVLKYIENIEFEIPLPTLLHVKTTMVLQSSHVWVCNLFMTLIVMLR